MTTRIAALFLVSSASLFLSGCSRQPPANPDTPAASGATATPSAPGAPLESIGSASMDPDGTLKLQLRASGPGPAVGDALLTYKKDDPRYQEILDHLGGLTPGQTKPVPPFPSTE